jgi:MerR family transcriptional regulator, light-induced transcriptional regulator
VPPTLNIAALTKRTGVPADTIRKWEQRYGVLKPERTSGGQRRYSEVDVARVEWLKARLGEGYRIGEAAALLGADVLAVESTDELREALLDATARGDAVAVERLVDQSLALRPLEESLLDVLAPALVAVGERWHAGEVSVAQEHLTSGIVRAAVQRLVADARGSVRGVAVLACAPAELHEVGLLMLAALLRADGWQVAYLGADTPVDDALELADRLDAAVMCFSATMPEHAQALRAALDVRPASRVAVSIGGRAVGGEDARAAVEQLRAVRA